MLSTLVDRLHREWLVFATPDRCHGCAAPTRGSAMCPACRSTLPWNEPACPRCAAPRSPGAGVCPDCLAQPPAQDCTWCAFRYEPPVAAHIVGLKFEARFTGARLLGELMAQALARRAAPLPELLIPVPLHEARLRRRGYNQALEIARELAQRLPLLLAPQLARRRQATREQTTLDAPARRRNVRDVFEVSAGVRGRRVALLDDVITTGATAGELARALRQAGAARVEAWAAARVP